MILTGESEVVGEKPDPVPLSPSQIPQTGLGSNLASVVTGQRLSA
jgi:hypothetical protein